MITKIEIDETQIEIIPEAYLARDTAIHKAELVTTVEDAFEAQSASTAMHALNEIVKGMEASRKDAKAPALQAGRAIDAIAKDFLASAQSELTRVKRLLGEYQRVEAEKKRKAEAEARRKEQAERAAFEQAERERIQKENAGRTGTLSQDLDKASEQFDKSVAKIKQKIAQSHSAVAGVKVRTTVIFKIIDESALMQARPELFTPDDKKIRAALKLTKQIPGLEVWEESNAYA
tara:strand:- start:452 stop:1150 length:699 start_codon:yes stop_codon:yes gene_type:complete